MKIKLFSLIVFFITLFVVLPPVTKAMDSMKMADPAGGMAMTSSIRLVLEGKPFANADVYMAHQSRVTDADGRADFENVELGKNLLRIVKDGKVQEQLIDVKSGMNEVVMNNTWQDYVLPGMESAHNTASQKSILLTAFVVLLCFGTAMVLIKKRHLLTKKAGPKSRTGRRSVIATFLVLGIISTTTLGYQLMSNPFRNLNGETLAATVGTNGIGIPQNVKVYPDDQVATVVWDEPATMGSIIGYVVRWGKNGTLTDSKQTTYLETQIQPLQNGVAYTVSVQAVTGKMVSPKILNGVSIPGKFAEYVGDNTNNLSDPVTATIVPTSARVDAQKSRLVGFFDDFNLPAGNFDERKWNTAYSACSDPGNNGAFINSQFHAHNQVKARSNYIPYDETLPYCDRAATASRVRPLWDISVGKDGVNPPSDANPALFEMDLDGVTRNRDKWYVDFIPATARKNGIPTDFEGHNTFFGDDSNWPGNVFRITQSKSQGENYGIDFALWGATGAQAAAVPIATTCGAWQYGAYKQPVVDLGSCGRNGITNPEFSPIAMPNHSSHGLAPIPNVRRHWVVAYAAASGTNPAKFSLYIDGVFIMSVKAPAFISSQQKLEVFSELFGYTTGKDYEFDSPVQPHTSIFHWDNTGFTGKAPTIVTHNYLDGGPAGDYPEYAMGRVDRHITGGNKTIIIPIPDQIGTPTQARLMFTFGPIAAETYKWTQGQYVALVKNGVETKLGGGDYVNPANNLVTALQNPIADSYTNFSDGIILTAQDIANLQTGANSFKFNLAGATLMNIHLELDYTKGTEPTFTQPQNVFKAVNFNSLITPLMSWSDSYLFIEQDLGLKLGVTSLPSPTQPVVPTVQPTTTIAPTQPPVGGGTGAFVPAMPLISKNIRAFALNSSGGNTANLATNAYPNDYWQAGTTASWLAYDLSGINAASRSKVLLAFYVLFPDFYERFGQTSQGIPDTYTIEGNTAAGGTASAPTANWQVLYSKSGNIFADRLHKLDLTGYNWVRLNVKSVRPGSTSPVHLDMELYDMSKGNTDSWLFAGDSITFISWGSQYFPSQPFDKYLAAEFPQNHVLNTNASMGGSSIGGGPAEFLENLDGVIEAQPARFYAISYGTNGTSDANLFFTQMDSVVQKLLAAGITPVIATVIGSPANQAKGPGLNDSIRKIYAKYPQQVIPGPDLWTIFNGKTAYFDADPTHPNATGMQAFRDAWGKAMHDNVYMRTGSGGSVTPTPGVPTAAPSATPFPATPTARPTSVPAATIVPSSTPRPTAIPSPGLPTATPRPTATVTPKPTATPVTSTGGTLGYKRIASILDTGDSNYINLSKFSMGTTTKVVKTITVYVSSVDISPYNKYQVGIYTDSSGLPRTLVAKSATGTLVPNAWNTIAISATLSARRKYWFGYNTNGRSFNVNNMKYDTTGTGAFSSNSVPFGTWPTTFGQASVGAYKFSIYATFQ